MKLDQAIQSQEHLEIHYLVDHYEAELYTHDGYYRTLIGKGENIDSAISDLCKQLANIEDIEVLRKLYNPRIPR